MCGESTYCERCIEELEAEIRCLEEEIEMLRRRLEDEVDKRWH